MTSVKTAAIDRAGDMRRGTKWSKAHRREWVRTMLLAVVTLFLLAPIAWMVLSSFKPNSDLYVVPIRWIPDHLTLDNYSGIVGQSWFWTYLMNSAVTAGATTAVTVVAATTAGYSLSRYRYRGHSAVMISLLGSQMFPQILLAAPLFLVFVTVGLLDTWAGLVAAYLALTLPFGTWMMTAYFNTIPQELEEAAYCDGAGRFKTLWRVVLPSAIPGIVSVALFTLLASWNEYLLTLILIQDDNVRTLTPGIAFRFTGAYSNDWGGIMAMATLMSAPIVILFLFLQKYFVEGLTAGAVKG